MARDNPSLKAHNSVITLVVYPIDLEYPLIHTPSLFLIYPPPPALSGFPSEAPSVLSLYQPENKLIYSLTKKLIDHLL